MAQSSAAAPIRSAAHRVASFDVADFPVPDGREEEWRFTPSRRLRGLFDGEPSDLRLKLTADLPDGVELVEVGATDPIRTAGPAPVDRIAALAHANAGGATVLRIPNEAVLDRPVFIERKGAGTTAPTWGHLVIEVGAFASATVVLDHTGSATFAGVLSVIVGDGAKLRLVSLQDWDDDSLHVEHQAARVGRDASYTSAVVTLGGDLVRLTPTVHYAGTGGSAELLGLYFADAGQHLEHRLFIDHGQPNCRSRVTYKGALQGDNARTVWIGDVLIRADATGTDTYEENRNLLLGDRARADSVPNLEIETGEVVGAGHASTTGRFDDEQLFYLMARGITEDEARRLVVRGFFADIVDRIGVPEVRERLLNAVEGELSR
ncbi:MAG TPA: Fe-S cluster assembly protein SufD [Mycobacteriales bacterium]|jgi:Fe-S cluster assembly protein SufD|nr:Fe-S cluster assembly protein SufD [Mycobacteriales bacterium]